ncbi:MAG: acyltransferase family protein [Clostridiales bacterium]|nr:acyltransferase family protein [Clostridiales bacterium]
MKADSITDRKSNKKFMLLSVIGIIMVVDLHCDFALNLLNFVIPYESFFIPLFIFISGYFNKVDDRTDLKGYLKRKAKKLLLPYLVISILMFWLEWAINSCKYGSLQPVTQETLLIPFVNVITVGYPVLLMSPMWYVIAFFGVTLVYAVLKKLIGSKWNSIVALSVFCLLNILVVWSAKTFKDSQVFFLLLLPMKTVFLLPFMELGGIYREKIEPKTNDIRIGWKIIMLMALIALNVARMKILPDPGDIEFGGLYALLGFSSPYYVTPLISSVIGILFWITLVEVLGKVFYENRVVNYISENTYYIMGFHLLCFNLINCVLLFINNNIHKLPGFDIGSLRSMPYYIWDRYPLFKFIYLILGVAGSLLIKLVFDKIIRAVRKSRPQT